MTALQPVANLARGALIGTVEVIPGVSGATVALIVGVYGAIIDAGSRVVRALAAGVDVFRGRGLARSLTHLRAVRWSLIAPILIGMVLAVLLGARLVAPLVQAYPVESRAVFAGLIAASLLVPIRLLGRAWNVRYGLLALVGAGVAFALSGFSSGTTSEPPLVVVALAASVVICALILPGVSGAFLLVVFGLYETTLVALNERNLPYLGAFILGAVLGFSVFVNVLRFLLARFREVMLALMTGLMLGSLRALWPWQTTDGIATAPTGEVMPIVLLAAGAAAIVVAVLSVQSARARRGVVADAP